MTIFEQFIFAFVAAVIVGVAIRIYEDITGRQV